MSSAHRRLAAGLAVGRAAREETPLCRRVSYLDYVPPSREGGINRRRETLMSDTQGGGDNVDWESQRNEIADQRDDIAAKRDARADERDRVSDHRELKVDAILAAASIRDERANLRDLDADQRDQADLLYAIVHDADDTRASQARSQASTDRMHSKGDRIASEIDRTLLADVGRSSDEREAAKKDAATADADRFQAARKRERSARRRSSHGRPLRIIEPEDEPHD
jgi:hypothetical protein